MFPTRKMNSLSKLSDKHCIPCEGGTQPLEHNESSKLLNELSPKSNLGLEQNWMLVEDKELEKTYVFKDFKEALEFVNEVGVLAEEQGHHPDISIHNYKKVTIRLSTHAIEGLSENDFIMASKIDGILAVT
jgi:4a-hydroxytetrahydrobiopterin dehydratase